MLSIFNINAMILVRNFLRRTRGRIFSVTFVKADGTIRTMNCKVLATPFMIKPNYVVLENNILQNTGTPKASIRSFKADRVIRMTCGKSEYYNPDAKQNVA